MSSNALSDDKVLVRILYYSSKNSPRGRRTWNIIAIPAPSDYLSTLPMSLPAVVGTDFEEIKLEVMAQVGQLLSDGGDYSGWTLYSFKGMTLEEEHRYTAEVVITRHVTPGPAAAAPQTLGSAGELN